MLYVLVGLHSLHVSVSLQRVAETIFIAQNNALFISLVFVKTWFNVEVPKYYATVTNLLLAAGAKSSWRGMRTVAQIKRDSSIRKAVNKYIYILYIYKNMIKISFLCIFTLFVIFLLFFSPFSDISLRQKKMGCIVYYLYIGRNRI